MLPPSLNGSVVLCQVAPLSVERRMAPLFGSQLLVYMPTAAYTRLGSTASVARLTTPFQPQLLQPTKSSSGTHLDVEGFQR
jgi:hypothetical protein